MTDAGPLAGHDLSTPKEAGPSVSSTKVDDSLDDLLFKERWTRRYLLLTRIQLSQTYHRRRERTFEWADRLAKFVAIVGSSAALSKLLGDSPLVVPAIALLIAATSALSLVFGWADRARRHAEFARSYARLAAEIVEASQTEFTDLELQRWSAKQKLIEGDEPAALYAVVTSCENEMWTAAGEYDFVVPLSRKERWLGWMIDFEPSEETIKKLKARDAEIARRQQRASAAVGTTET